MAADIFIRLFSFHYIFFFSKELKCDTLYTPLNSIIACKDDDSCGAGYKCAKVFGGKCLKSKYRLKTNLNSYMFSSIFTHIFVYIYIIYTCQEAKSRASNLEPIVREIILYIAARVQNATKPDGENACVNKRKLAKVNVYTFYYLAYKHIACGPCNICLSSFLDN